MPAAREILSAAHARMTPDEIAAHALVLAQLVEGQVGLVKALLELAQTQAQRIDIVEAYGATLIRAISDPALEHGRIAAAHRAHGALDFIGLRNSMVEYSADDGRSRSVDY